jgi:hypothetical protein
MGLFEREYYDVGGEEVVEFAAGAFRDEGDFAAKLGVGDLSKGVDAGIRTS